VEKARDGGRDAAVALAGARPAMLVHAGTPLEEVLRLLEGYEPSDETADLPAALRMAAELYPPPVEFHIVTVRPGDPPSVGESPITLHRLAGRGGNLAFTGLWREGEGMGETLYLAMTNFAEHKAEARLDIADDDDPGAPPLDSRMLAWEPGEMTTLELRLSPGVGTLRASLTALVGEDVIRADSEAYIPPPPPSRVSYAVDLPGDDARYWRLGLEAAGAYPWTVDAPGGGEGPDMLVTSDPAARGLTLTVEALPEGESRTLLPPYVVDYADALCRDVHLGAVAWVAATEPPADPPPAALIAKGTATPLLWRMEPGRLAINIAAAQGDLARHAAWPALLANMVEEARARRPGLKKTLYLPGEALSFVPRPAATTPDVQAAPAPLRLFAGSKLEAEAPAVLRLPSRPGRYTVREGAALLGEAAVAASYVDASDARRLAERAETRVFDRAGADARGVHRFAWLALALALALLAVNWRLG
jgi:hypothetical protein